MIHFLKILVYSSALVFLQDSYNLPKIFHFPYATDLYREFYEH